MRRRAAAAPGRAVVRAPLRQDLGSAERRPRVAGLSIVRVGAAGRLAGRLLIPTGLTPPHLDVAAGWPAAGNAGKPYFCANGNPVENSANILI